MSHDTQTLTLIEFLLARIAEDEAEIGAPFGRDEKAGPNGLGWAEVGAINDVLMCGHVRALAECEAKRRIVELHVGSLKEYRRYLDSAGDDAWYQCAVCEDGPGRHEGDIEHQQMPCPTLRILALPYADHADYREGWRP